MKTYNRRGNKWSINETLQLQREYELLEWNVSEIAEKHQRSIESILYRLETEGFIDSWKNARGYCYNEYNTSLQNDSINFVVNSHDENVSEEEKTNDDKLDDRVCNLESSVKEIASMVKQILTSITEKNIQTNNSRNKLYL